MDLSGIIKKYADEIGGQFTQYDQNQSIIIIPLPSGRFQTVLGKVKKNELYNCELLTINSKVCDVNNHINYKTLLEEAVLFDYCRFVINENYLQIEAIAPLDNISESTIKKMLQEVANLSDQYEMKLTGKDIH